jgi:hypothetical protein
MRLVLLILGGIALFFFWIFFGSQAHCPRCGVNLRIEHSGPLAGPIRNSCACGWRANQ